MAKEQPTNSNNDALIRRVLTKLFGLDTKAVDQIMRVIKNTNHVVDIKTQMVRRRIGTRGMELLKQTLAAVSADKEKDEEDATKDDKPVKAEKKAEKPVKAEKKDDKKEKVKESFASYLINEMGTADQTSQDSNSDNVMVSMNPDQIRDPKMRQDAKRKQTKQNVSKSSREREYVKQIKTAQAALKALRSGQAPEDM